MRYKSLFFITVLIVTGCSVKQDQKNKPVPIIFDTDIGPDYDDVGAITILHALAQKGEAKILATVADNKYDGIAAVLNLFNTYWKEPDIPIGVPKQKAVSKADRQHWTDTILAKYPHEIKSNDAVPGSVEVYRKVLAAQPDTSVVVVSVGFLTNLSNLLKSDPDEHSPLSGIQLVRKKVKLLVCMAGKYPSGKEFNMYYDPPASQYVCTNWPTPVIFSGWEIGSKVKTGLPLVGDNSIQNNPAKDVFRISIPMSPEDSAGRSSWDEITTLVAVRGYKPYFTLQSGRVIVNNDGSNSWNNNGNGHYYLVQKSTPEKLEDVIDRLMMQQPEAE